MEASPSDVRFTSESGHPVAARWLVLVEKSGHYDHPDPRPLLGAAGIAHWGDLRCKEQIKMVASPRNHI